MNTPSPRPKLSRPRTKTATRTKQTVTAAKLADVLLRYFAKHPQAGYVAVTVQGKKFVVQPQKPVLTAHRKAWPVAPAGYFARFYTGQLAAEDNQHAAHSTRDPADFTE